MKKKNIIGLLVTIAVFAVVLVLSIYFFSNREPVYLQGQVEAKQIKVAPKVPGRVKAIYKQEGDQVHKGDLLWNWKVPNSTPSSLKLKLPA